MHDTTGAIRRTARILETDVHPHKHVGTRMPLTCKAEEDELQYRRFQLWFSKLVLKPGSAASLSMLNLKPGSQAWFSKLVPEPDSQA